VEGERERRREREMDGVEVFIYIYCLPPAGGRCVGAVEARRERAEGEGGERWMGAEGEGWRERERGGL
jgi:hypothetical protein